MRHVCISRASTDMWSLQLLEDPVRSGLAQRTNDLSLLGGISDANVTLIINIIFVCVVFDCVLTVCCTLGPTLLITILPVCLGKPEINGSYFKTLRAVTVRRSGQHALDQTSKASYLFLHCLHALQAMVSAKENASDEPKTCRRRRRRI